MRIYFRLLNRNDYNDVIQFAVRDKNNIHTAILAVSPINETPEQLQQIRDKMIDQDDKDKWDAFVTRVGIENVSFVRA